MKKLKEKLVIAVVGLAIIGSLNWSGNFLQDHPNVLVEQTKPTTTRVNS
ncbi:hypothetical protein [Lactiplantibacillus garii]|nr:hypothetical protein [Lactiplantibacillus garii]